MKRLVVIGMTVFCLFFLASMSFAGNWILDSPTGKLPSDLSTKIALAGGTLIKTMDEVGIAVAEFTTREDAEAMEAYGFKVMPDVELNYLAPQNVNSPHIENIGENEGFYHYQWHLPVIQAPLAWDAGYTGAGARVAVLDSGIWYTHVDLAGQVDLAASRSFVPGSTSFLDNNGHGTHVAGIIAAADNSLGTIGVAPHAILIAVKVLGSSGTGAWSWLLNGIVYAADQNVDIINMSLGGIIKKSGTDSYTANDVANLVAAMKKAMQYARKKGALIICAAGNDSLDLDHSGNLMDIPAEACNGVVVSATGPIALQDFDHFASYSNYGSSAITVAAPGGDSISYPTPNWYLDMILSTIPSTSNRSYTFMSGTSMAAPVAAGVAALIVGKYGKMTPAQLEHILTSSADDLGKQGTDPYYGKGRVNAYEAVK